MRLDDAVLRVWRERRAADLDSAITVRLALTTPVDEGLRALEAVVGDVVEGAQVDEAPYRGEWSWVRDGSGVLVTILESEVLDEVLPAVVAGLEERGVDGTVSVYERRAGAPLWCGPLIEARMRVRGHREQIAGRRGARYKWRPDGGSVQRALDVALEWCTHDARSEAWLLIGVNPDVAMAPDEVADRVREALRDAAAPVEVRSAERGVVVDQFAGRVALIEPDARWRRGIGPVVDVLRSAAPDLAYALVKTGWSAMYVMQGESLGLDWPPRPDLDPDRAAKASPFEDEYAPDAFAIQLLGPGYAGRIPATPRYTATPVGAATLLEHADLGAWFETPFIPADIPWTHIREVAPPTVLAEARDALAPILFHPERL